MADSSGFPAPFLGMTARGVQEQRQVQRMSQQQIMSLKLLAMGSLDLREAIYRHAAENPALEITRDALESGVGGARRAASRFSDDARYGRATAAGAAASDSFQAALESAEDSRASLQEHLEHQFNASAHTPDETELALALIHNLDANGFHILAPQSLLNKSRPAQDERLLRRCMDEIRALDPVGTCCAGVEESLYVQARLRPDAPRAALVLLDGHLALLEPPQPEKVLKKLNAYLAGLERLSFLSDEERRRLTDARARPFTLAETEAAIAFIRTLDPYPARNFSSSQTQFVAPDVYVEKLPLLEDDEPRGIISPPAPPAASTAAPAAERAEPHDGARASGTGAQERLAAQAPAASGAHSFKITLARDAIPAVTVSKDFLALTAPRADGGSPRARADSAGGAGKAARKFAADAVRDARAFIESVQFRESTVMRAACEIVRAQLAFFEHGPRALVPLRQKDIAARLGVHEATISRMAKGKYLQCEWGLFEFGYFFTNAVGEQGAAGGSTGSGDAPAGSKEAVKYEIAAVLKAHSGDKKQLSDQKLADLLAEKGIKIARRTVAKYRAELNINSSYSR